MSYKDPEKQRQYQREQMRLLRSVTPAVIPQARSITESPVIPDQNVIPAVIPADQLIPTEPYNEQEALDHMMSMYPVYSDKVITTSGGVRCRPVIGWREGEAWKPTPVVIKVDRARLARLKKVIKDMELVKVA